MDSEFTVCQIEITVLVKLQPRTNENAQSCCYSLFRNSESFYMKYHLLRVGRIQRIVFHCSQRRITIDFIRP